MKLSCKTTMCGYLRGGVCAKSDSVNSGLCLGCSSSYPQASRATFQQKVGAQEMFIDGVLTE